MTLRKSIQVLSLLLLLAWGASAQAGADGVGTKTVRHPVVKIKCKRIKCAKCGSWYHPDSGCCGTVGPEVLKRATAQGGTGEPHIGLIPTMKVLAP